jgi:hypothetical protein
MLGPAWTGRGRPPAGYFTKRLAEDWLRNTLDEIRFGAGSATSRPLEDRPGEPLAAQRGTASTNVRSGATFADAAVEYLRFAEQDRGCKPSTVRGLPLGDPGAPVAGVRLAGARGRHRAGDRALALGDVGRSSAAGAV